MSQPLPIRGRRDVTPVVRERFARLLDDRERRGIATYGTTLQTHNGRDALQDALEEAVDLVQYLYQKVLEEEDSIRLWRAEPAAEAAVGQVHYVTADGEAVLVVPVAAFQRLTHKETS